MRIIHQFNRNGVDISIFQIISIDLDEVVKKYYAIFKDVLVKIEERRDNKVRHNIFDSIPSNIVSGKDNVFANFLQSAGLYDSMQIGEDNIQD